MRDALDHFRSLSSKLDSERLAFLAQADDLRGKISATAATIVRIENDGGNASKEIAALKRLKNERAALQSPSFADPLPDLEFFARSHKDARPVDPATIKLPNGQTWLVVHRDLVKETDQVLAEIIQVNSTPAVVDAAALGKQIEAIATPPRVINGRLIWPQHSINAGGNTVTVTNFEGVLAWLHGDALTKKLSTKPEPNAISTEDRVKRVGDLVIEFANALRRESAAAMKAEQSSQRVTRRRHVHPAVLLGVEASPAAIYDWFMKKRGA